MLKSLSHTRLCAVFALCVGGPAFAAYDGTVSMSGCPTVTLRVDDISSATAWGAHFSLSSSENGYGGTYPECHITPDSSDNLVVLCYDGYLSSSYHTNAFRLDLGPREDVESVTFDVGMRGVDVRAGRYSTNAYTSELIQYPVEGHFPMRESTGFCASSFTSSGSTPSRSSTLYYKANGVFTGTTGRTGSGHTLTVTSP